MKGTQLHKYIPYAGLQHRSITNSLSVFTIEFGVEAHPGGNAHSLFGANVLQTGALLRCICLRCSFSYCPVDNALCCSCMHVCNMCITCNTCTHNTTHWLLTVHPPGGGGKATYPTSTRGRGQGYLPYIHQGEGARLLTVHPPGEGGKATYRASTRGRGQGYLPYIHQGEGARLLTVHPPGEGGKATYRASTRGREQGYLPCIHQEGQALSS